MLLCFLQQKHFLHRAIIYSRSKDTTAAATTLCVLEQNTKQSYPFKEATPITRRDQDYRVLCRSNSCQVTNTLNSTAFWTTTSRNNMAEGNKLFTDADVRTYNILTQLYYINNLTERSYMFRLT